MPLYSHQTSSVNFTKTLARVLNAKSTYEKANIFAAHLRAIGFHVRPIHTAILRYMAERLHYQKPFLIRYCAKAVGCSVSTARRHFRNLSRNGALQCLPVAVSLLNAVIRTAETIAHKMRSARKKLTTYQLKNLSKRQAIESTNITKGRDLDGPHIIQEPILTQAEQDEIRLWETIKAQYAANNRRG